MNIARCDDVGAIRVAADYANEFRSADAACRIYHTALAARLLGVCRLDLEELTTTLDKLVTEHGREHPPALIEDGAR